MRSKGGSVVLASYEDIFGSNDAADGGADRVIEVSLPELYAFENHPFKVMDDESMADTVESVKRVGVLIPAIVRARQGGGYEIISGHRRKRACELAGLRTMPVIVRDMDDDEAIIYMVDTNLQRETILPSEKAFAYKMKMDAIKRQAGRRTKNLSPLETNLIGKNSGTILAEKSDDSKPQIFRYIRLTELIPDLLSKVDSQTIAFRPAVELSYLSPDEQEILQEAIELTEATPSLSQAQRLKKLSQAGPEPLTMEAIEAILAEEKKDLDKVVIKGKQLKLYFPSTYTPRQMEEIILRLLEDWVKKQRFPLQQSPLES